MVTEERKRELYSLWLDEDIMDGEDWRGDLRGEELALINWWDMQYNSSVYRLCLDILQAEQ